MAKWTIEDVHARVEAIRERIDYLYVTKHGRQRVRQRVGIPRRSAGRAARTAFERGELVLATDRPGCVSIRHGEHVWHYGMDACNAPKLITVYPLSFYDRAADGGLRVVDQPAPEPDE